MSDDRSPDTASFSAVLPDDVEELAHDVLRRARDLDLSLATAESCTGGLLASVLTDVPDLSGWFERGFVVYSPPSKQELLGVDEALIDEHGAVSETVAVAMARGALASSLAHVAVALTGFADEGEEPGLVHGAAAWGDGDVVHRVEQFGSIGRGPVRVASVRMALQLLGRAMDQIADALEDAHDG